MAKKPVPVPKGMTDYVGELKVIMRDLEEDVQKVSERGVRAAGKRARKNLQEMKKIAQALRLVIMDEIRKD